MLRLGAVCGAEVDGHRHGLALSICSVTTEKYVFFISSSLVVFQVYGKTVMAGMFPIKWKYKKGPQVVTGILLTYNPKFICEDFLWLFFFMAKVSSLENVSVVGALFYLNDL